MLSLQIHALFVLMLAGIGTGVLYDLVRAVRRELRRFRWLRELCDWLFCAAAALLMGGGIMLANWGDPRGYVPLAVLAGLMVYMLLASPVVQHLCYLVVRLISWPLRILHRLFAAHLSKV